MWSKHTYSVIWSSLVPCSTWYSTSKVINSVSTRYETLPVTSYTWTTGTSFTTISTTVTDTSYTTRTTNDTSWTTATTLTTEPFLVTELYSITQTFLTTKPVLFTQYFDTTETLLTTKPILIYETVQTTLTGRETQTDVETQTALTTLTSRTTYVISETALTTLTHRTTYETIETETTRQTLVATSSSLSPTSSSSSTSVSPEVSIPLPSNSSAPPISSSPLVVVTTTPTVVPTPQNTIAPPPVTAAPPVPSFNACDRPPVDDFFQVSWFGWRPVPGAEPLATLYRTVDTISNLTVTSIFCNTPVFEKYYRTNLFDCTRGCGPYQTLDNECNIVVGPVFTGTRCAGSGYKITQRGPSGNVVNLDTSIIGRGLTINGRCVPVTSTTLQTPFIYTGDVRQVDSFNTALERRQAQVQSQANLILPNLPESSSITPFNQPTQANVQLADGVAIKLGGAGTLIPPEATASLDLSPTDVATAQAANDPTSPPQQQPQTESAQLSSLRASLLASLIAELGESPSATESSSTARSGVSDGAISVGSSPSAIESSSTVRSGASSGDTSVAPSPLSPTPQTTASSTARAGFTPVLLPSEASLPALTCVPLSMVLPPSAANNSTAGQASLTTVGASAPVQTGNSALRSMRLSTALGWVCASVAMRILM